MGISFSVDKPYILDLGQMVNNLEDCPDQFGNLNQIGKVYVIRHKTGSTTDKSAHVSIYLDIGGKLKNLSYTHSNVSFSGESLPGKRLSGIHTHLVVFQLSTIKTNLLDIYESHDWNSFDDVHLVGQLNVNQILLCGTPVVYSIQLQRQLSTWYGDLVISNNNNIYWSSILNCQQYAFKVIVNLGFNWPEKYHVAGDTAPYFVDIYIKSR